MPHPKHSPIRQYPLLFPLAFLAAGIVLGVNFYGMVSGAAWMMSAAASVALTMLGWLLRKRRREAGAGATMHCERRKRLTEMGMAAVMTLTAGAALGALKMEHTDVKWPTAEQTWTVEVTQVGKRDEAGCRLDARIQGGHYDGRTVHLTLRDSTLGTKGMERIGTGDGLILTARIRAPRNAGNPDETDYRRYLLTHSVSGTAWCDSLHWQQVIMDGGDVSPTLRQRLIHLRQRMTDTYAHHFGGQTLEVLAALTLGDRTLLADDTRRLFADTGASHVLALSGLHLGIVFGLYLMFVRRRCRLRRTIVAATVPGIVALWTFVLATGESTSLVRAATMMTLILALGCFRLKMPMLHNLLATALLLVLADPLAVTDVGLQLSVAAVAGIGLFNDYIRPCIGILNLEGEWYIYPPERTEYITIATWLKRRVRYHLRRVRFFLRDWAVEMFFVSIAAQVATLPLVVWHFHQFSPYGIAATFVVVPLAMCILTLSATFFIMPFAQGGIATLLAACTRLMTGGLTLIGMIPGACIHWWPSAVTAAAAGIAVVLFAAWCILPERRRLAATAAALALTCALVVVDARPTRVKPHIQVYATGRVTTIHFIRSARRSYLLSSASADSTARALRMVAQTHWRRWDMAVPQTLADEARNAEIARRGDDVVFGPWRVKWVHGALPQISDNRKREYMDLLVVSRGCRNTAEELTEAFHPRHVVLDASLYEKQRQVLAAAFKAAGIDVHEGAWALECAGGRGL